MARRLLSGIRRWPAATIALFVAATAGGCGSEPAELRFSGLTMATRYAIAIREPGAIDARSLQRRVDGMLAGINETMSTYDPQSELSRLNANPSTDWIAISKPLYEVLAAAEHVNRASAGAFDVTIGPLVNLWGFGPTPREARPGDAAIRAALERVGQANVELRASPLALRKRRADIYIDLSGIAKGYAVDRIATLLEEAGASDYLVEIGGEVRARGRNRSGDAWQIGVESPASGTREIARVVPLRDNGMASSGSYRNFFEHDGIRYSHMIDPRTGYPVAGPLAGVTVIHPSAMMADAWATALMTLGAERAPTMAGARGLAALFFTISADTVTSEANAAFDAATVHE